MSEAVFTNARVVLPDAVIARGTVVVRDGAIAEIAEGVSSAPGALDLDGDDLLPGAVEIHTDNLEVCFAPRPSVRWPADAALLVHDGQVASVGITTVCDAVCVGFYGNDKKRLELLQRSIDAVERAAARGKLKAEHHLHLRCEVTSPQVLDLFAPLVERRHLRVVSLMDHTPGQRQWRDVETWLNFLVGRGHSRDGALAELDRRREDQATYAERHRAAILSMIEGRGLALASHDDTTEAHVEQAYAEGVTVAEFPTTVEAARAARRLGLKTVMGGPNVVLGGSHSGNIAASDLAEAGLLDLLSSDYVPASLFHAAYRLHGRHGLSLSDAVNLVTLNPAETLGFADRGAIRVGRRADLVWAHDAGEAPAILGAWRDGLRVA